MTTAELLGRIGRAFTRTFDLVMEGAFSDLLLLGSASQVPASPFA